MTDKNDTHEHGADTHDHDMTYENESTRDLSPMVRISIKEYDSLRQQQKMIVDPDLIAVIDKMDELLRVLKRRINRSDSQKRR